MTPNATKVMETAVDPSKTSLCLHHLIREQALKTPGEAALAFENEKLTYRELDRRANQLARHLKGLGLGPDTFVGILVERSLEMVVGILGVLQAGAAYVPIDPDYPSERVAFILSDAGVSILLTQTSLTARLAENAFTTICLDTFDWNAVEDQPSEEDNAEPTSAAYVIYTSGSTGRPKGVCIEHRNIVSYVRGVAERLNFEPGMNHAMVSTVAADLGHTVLFPALSTGGCLHVISQERLQSQAKLAEYFTREKIDVLKIVPSHLAALQTGKGAEQVMPRKRLILGGESSRTEWIEGLRSLAPNCEIHNHYGPSETTVGVLTYRVEGKLPPTLSGTLPLGKPLPNSRVHILDAQGQQVPVGVVGELCIAGEGVARGYLNQAELTAQKFVSDPFGEPGQRLYKTGDLARYLADGDIEFCGRIDHQVKIHGYRIELGEIEAALREHPGVREALAVADDDGAGGKRLAAYVTPQQADQPLWSQKSVHLLPDGLSVAHLNRNETDYIHNEIFRLQAYLRHGITINDGDCIVDAGANIGLFTVFACRAAANVKIFAFEPNPAAHACLSSNARAWGENVKCLPLGLSRENKTAELTFFEGMSLLSGFYADAATEREVVKNYVLNQQSADDVLPSAAELEGLIDGRLRVKTETAELRTLSSMIAEQGIDRIDLLKINVEKSELDVLLGIDAGDWGKIRQLVIEVDQQQSLEPITSLLVAQGFEVLAEQDLLLQNTELCYVYARSASAGALIRNQADGEHLRILPPVNPRILTPAVLRKHLQDRLPAYMVPSTLLLLEKFPLTSNGKIDRNALSHVATAAPSPAPESARTHTATEESLSAIWKESLKVENVGIHDDFFDLGGHSLLAIKTISRIRDTFGVDLTTQTLFENSTIARLAKIVDEAAGTIKTQDIEPRKQDGPFPLSSNQTPLWFLHQLSPDSPAYNIVDVVPIHGIYDAAALQKALDELVRRHEILRTVFTAQSEDPQQVVLPKIELRLAEVDLSRLPREEREREWRRIAREEGRKPFTLEVAPLFRGTIVHLSKGTHRLLLTIHHIIADEWSMELIQREVRQMYEAFFQGLPSLLPELPIQYADFVRWKRESIQPVILEKQLAYWRQELESAPPFLQLPTDRPRPAVSSFCGAIEVFQLKKPLVDRIKALARQEQATLFMILEAGFAALLRRYTGQNDILVGTPITGRTHSGTEQLIGCFLNSIVLRAQFTEDLSFRTLLRQTRGRVLRAFSNADLPFEQLVAQFAPERDSSRTPLFQVMFVLHDSGGVSQVSTVSGQEQLETGTSKFDLTLVTSETAKGVDALLEYSTDLFDAATIRRMAAHYSALMETIVQQPDQIVARLPILTSEERAAHAIWNDTGAPFPEMTVHELISEQTKRTPGCVAVESEGRTLTYAELEDKAATLARRLRAYGVGPGVRVAVFMERSLEMMIGLLGVMTAGAAYVPLDPAFPAERLAFMVADSGAAVLLTQRSVISALSPQAIPVVCVDEDGPARPAHDLEARSARPEDLIYVIYTSGSTGQPKGVAVTHRSLVNLLESIGREPGFTATDVLLSVTTLSFDIAALELYLPLIKGGRVVLASREETVDGQRLIDGLRSSKATVMQATPSTWQMLIEAGWQGTPGLKVLCGGEALSRDLANHLLPRAAELWNVYGPTETTVWSTVERVEPGSGPITIGRPLANTQLWILDEHLSPLPAGVQGELYIGGVGLAQGYWNRPDLTAERFIPDPFNKEGTGRLYRTGDLVRRLADGRVECLGRIDHQIKLRGFRIEIGEIEACIRRHRSVGEVVVIARDDGAGKYLAAYVVAENQSELAEQLAASLHASLPDYMVPREYVFLDRLPLTPNGKIDRKALPAPLRTVPGAAVRPLTATEELVVRAFCEVLTQSDVGPNDNFFDLGGHSLMASRLLYRLRDSTRLDLPFRSLMEHPTPGRLARIIDGLAWLGEPRKSTGEVREEIEL